ncbi:hypothetical protein QMA10_06140 [Arthrobacter sp. APC 3897]|nr:hypothetical protein [Arthrobacter sp. APC 3897]MDN3481501.1 hypothetical protein [Arthrobacter sp. APC 3897]
MSPPWNGAGSYRRTRREWLTLAGLALLVMVTTVMVAAAFGR